MCCVYICLSKKFDHFQSFFVNPPSHNFVYDTAQNQVSTRLKKPRFFSDSHIWDYLVILHNINYAMAILYYSSFTIMMSPDSEISLSQYFVFHNQISNLILNFLLLGQLFTFHKNTDHNLPSSWLKVLHK